MTYQGYAERDLVKNRSSLLIYGSTEPDRRAWAENAAATFAHEGPLRAAGSGPEVLAALAIGRGVLYVPDVTVLGDGGQIALVRALRPHAERPKLVLGLPGAPTALREAGRLRPDLQYALQWAQVNLDQGSRPRRKGPAKAAAKPAQKARAHQKASPARKARSAGKTKPAARAKPARAKPARPKAPTRKAATRKPAPKKSASRRRR